MACQNRQTQNPSRCGNSVSPNERCARYTDVIKRRPSVMERIDTAERDRDYFLNFMDTIPITRNTPLEVLKNVPPGTIVQIFDFPDEDKQSCTPENSRINQTCPPRIKLEKMGPAERFVKNAITSDKVVIFSTTTCPYCKMAKEQFQKLNQKFTSIELNQRDDKDELLDVLVEITGEGRTVPKVFVNGKFIGGGTDVKEMYENGSLGALFANCPRIKSEKMGPGERFVKNAIASDKVVIFSTTTCPYCKIAKEQFQKLNQKFTSIELNQRDDADELLDALGEITGGRRTVPRIFVNGKFIGTNVKEMYENGSLRALLAK